MDDLTFVRKFAPGLIGGREMCDLATDAELKYLIVLCNEQAEFYNRKIQLDEEIANFKKAILERGRK